MHHANLLVDRTGSAPGKGFPGMDVTILRSPFDPDGNFLFWKPGSVPHTEPVGFAWRLDPGNELVLNTHLHPTGKPEEVRPAITHCTSPIRRRPAFPCWCNWRVTRP